MCFTFSPETFFETRWTRHKYYASTLGVTTLFEQAFTRSYTKEVIAKTFCLQQLASSVEFYQYSIILSGLYFNISFYFIINNLHNLSRMKRSNFFSTIAGGTCTDRLFFPFCNILLLFNPYLFGISDFWRGEKNKR